MLTAAMSLLTWSVVAALHALAHHCQVADVIVVFGAEAERQYRATGLDKSQRQCIQFVLSAKPERLFQALYRAQHKALIVVRNTLFDTFIMVSILLNTVTLLMQYKGMPEGYSDAMDTCNLVFTSVFVFEAVVKLVALNPTTYFVDNWNLLDFIIVVGSIVDVALAGASVSIGFLRLFRIARVAKLVAGSDDMKQLLSTFVQAFKSLPYVVLLMMLVFYIFAVVGMESFGKIGPSVEEGNADGVFDEFTNFRTFGSALYVLIRSSTGEGCVFFLPRYLNLSAHNFFYLG